MNIDDLLGKLMPLFEKKMEFSMEMSKRAMSLEERKEANKTDLEYKKLEAQITNDKDKLKWEKEKLTTTIKGGYDLEVLKNSGMMDQERLKNLGAKERVEIDAASKERIAKMGSDSAEANKYLNTLGVVLGHAVEKTGVDAQGNPYSQKPTKEVGIVARSLMEKSGIASPVAPAAQARNVAGEAEVAAGVLRENEKAGTADAGRNYLNALPADTRQAALALLNPGGVAPATGVAPITPTPEAREPIPAVQPITQPIADTSRSVIQPAAPSPPAQPVAAASAVRPYVAPTYEGSYGTIAAPTVPSPAAPASPSLQDSYGAGIRQRLQATVKTPEEEEKNRALRRARGLTVGGF